MCKEALLACYACFQLQLEAGKALFKGLGRAKMSEKVILGVSQAEYMDPRSGGAGLTTRRGRYGLSEPRSGSPS